MEFDKTHISERKSEENCYHNSKIDMKMMRKR